MGAKCPNCEEKFTTARGVLRHLKTNPKHRPRFPRLPENEFVRRATRILWRSDLSAREKVGELQYQIFKLPP